LGLSRCINLNNYKNVKLSSTSLSPCLQDKGQQTCHKSGKCQAAILLHYNLFPLFDGWAEGYGAFTVSYIDMGRASDYVKNQKEHHNKRSFEEEYKNLLRESGIEPDERYFP
jgi:hypothetical protein